MLLIYVATIFYFCRLLYEVFLSVFDLADRLVTDVPDRIDKRQNHVEPVFYDDHAITRLRERAQRSHQHCRTVFIEIGERLVEDDDLLPHSERACRNQPLFLPAGQRAASPLRVQLHKAADDFDLLLYLFRRKREIFAAESDFILYYLLNDLLVGVL